MSRRLLVLILCGLALPRVVSAQEAQAQKGRQVYDAQKCSVCHSIAGKGNTKGPLDGVGTKWKPNEIREWIVNWKEMAKKHNATRLPPMKDFSKLPAAEVDALVSYLETLK